MSILVLSLTFLINCQGLTNLGGIVGIVLAMLITGPLNDWGIVWISQRNRGIYEPEYRLVFMLGMLFGVFGYVGWAVGNDHHMPWIGAVACITYVPFSVIHYTRFIYPVAPHTDPPCNPHMARTRPRLESRSHRIRPPLGPAECSTSAWSCPARPR